MAVKRRQCGRETRAGRRPVSLNSDGPCRCGSERLVVWQVAHCCLKSAAPSGGVAGGGLICAVANLTAGIAPLIPIPMADRDFLINVFVGASQALGHWQEAMAAAGCFAGLKAAAGSGGARPVPRMLRRTYRRRPGAGPAIEGAMKTAQRGADVDEKV
jgi:hypothetical protein